MLGLHCCAGFPLAVVSGALSPRASPCRGFSLQRLRQRLLCWRSISGCRAYALSVAVAHGLQSAGLNSCDAWVLLPRDARDFPGSGTEPVSQALAGRFSFPLSHQEAPSPPFFYFVMMIGAPCESYMFPGILSEPGPGAGAGVEDGHNGRGPVLMKPLFQDKR